MAVEQVELRGTVLPKKVADGVVMPALYDRHEDRFFIQGTNDRRTVEVSGEVAKAFDTALSRVSSGMVLPSLYDRHVDTFFMPGECGRRTVEVSGEVAKAYDRALSRLLESKS